jgi:hypothetical protein
MHLIKYNSRQVLNSNMFWHQGVIIREVFRTKEYKPQHVNLDIVSPLWEWLKYYNIIILKYAELLSIKLQVCNIKIEPFQVSVRSYL